MQPFIKTGFIDPVIGTNLYDAERFFILIDFFYIFIDFRMFIFTFAEMLSRITYPLDPIRSKVQKVCDSF